MNKYLSSRAIITFALCLYLLALCNPVLVIGQVPMTTPPLPSLPPSGSALFKSNDSGATWTAFSAGLSCRSVERLAADPKSPNVLYAGTDRGMFRTTDGGNHWTQSNGVISLFLFNSLVIDPVETSTVYAAGPSYHLGAVLKSDDAGLNWKIVFSISRGNINHFEIDPKDHNTLYAIDDFDLYKSSDGGNHWASMLSFPPSGSTIYNSTFRIDPTDSSIVYVVANARLFKTTDGGSSWNDITDRALSPSNGEHTADLRVDPIDPSLLYLSSSSGLRKTTDGGATWQDARDDHSLRINNVLSDSAAPSALYGIETTTQGFSLTKSTDGGSNWAVTGLIPLSFSVLAVDSTNPSTIYAGTSDGKVPTDTPWIQGFAFDGKKLFVYGQFFDDGAVILLNGKKQPTKLSDSVLVGKKAGKKIKNNPEIKVQIRNSNGKVSQEVIVLPPFD
jgi:photosystem II stability/assembly factor-like uncharacterized protein